MRGVVAKRLRRRAESLTQRQPARRIVIHKITRSEREYGSTRAMYLSLKKAYKAGMHRPKKGGK